MGTKAFMAVSNTWKVESHTPILGLLMDGTPQNLAWLAKKTMETAKKMRVLTRFRKGDAETVSLVLDKVSKDEDNFPFTDIAGNAQWISYSAILNPKLGTFVVYKGKLEHRISYGRVG